MTVVAIGCDALVTVLGIGLKPGDNGLLSDVKMAKATDQTHAI